jgi:hypothetical protein
MKDLLLERLISRLAWLIGFYSFYLLTNGSDTFTGAFSSPGIARAVLEDNGDD